MRTPRGAVEPGSVVAPRELASVSGPPVAVPGPGRLTHLQFRRFAGCPVCNLHLRSVARRHDEIEAAGIREVVVFHSPVEELAEHAAGLPFTVVADPGRLLYTEFGVESAARSLLDPRAWGPVVLAVARGGWEVLRGREHLPASRPNGGRLGLPADFLVADDGRVVARKYGEHTYDQWSVDELLRLASAGTNPAATGPQPPVSGPSGN
ncbi:MULTISPECIES: peroxiredoxin-like family protein [Streptomyces]|uniref:AhpC/TSA family protein n=1 Tax=Streptomyces lycii TaxID=2654337 RepID=A0ABQ7FRV2_9ACTN|nr:MULTISPECIES: peroxiredoxin-like family protein [Streptomyces]KAF4410766.1 AhpC/TSA family protein [Streptomyces lycii]PGH50767.1 alkyl hydroperoxide reductase [Streptomyces sp. Ru87]